MLHAGNLKSNGTVNYTIHLYGRPLTSFARQTQTDTEIPATISEMIQTY
jgi:hypothetical protein